MLLCIVDSVDRVSWRDSPCWYVSTHVCPTYPYSHIDTASRHPFGDKVCTDLTHDGALECLQVESVDVFATQHCQGMGGSRYVSAGWLVEMGQWPSKLLTAYMTNGVMSQCHLVQHLI